MMETIARRAPVVLAAPDDLTRISGIGPKISGVLAEAGITTFAQLAGSGTDRLRRILDAAGIRATPDTWPAQAGKRRD